MVAMIKEDILIDDWRGLYGESWQGDIVADAFAHPAKYSRALIRRIYQHLMSESWVHTGDSVIDPFGGVALGALDALTWGLNWTGVELEAKFVSLGNENLTLWDERFAGKLQQWGSARLIQGDSRNLASVIESANCAVSSPPYTEKGVVRGGDTFSDGSKSRDKRRTQGGRLGASVLNASYGSDPANLGNLKADERSFNAAISSPPYIQSLEKSGGIDPAKSAHIGGPHSQMNNSDTRYGSSEGQLGALPEGSFNAAITSPPFVESLASDEPQKRGGLFRDSKRANDKTLTATYGDSEGQLGAMKTGDYQAAISSPPYEATDRNGKRPNAITNLQRKLAEGTLTGRESIRIAKKGAFNQNTENNIGGYGDSTGQLSAERGSDFWSAARLIVEQLHQVLAPNAHAVFVCKDFVRKKQIVPFCQQWAQLCESVGFRLVHWHKCWLVEDYGEQANFFQEPKQLRVERKSFFRRLAESKGSPRIDYEVVMCLERL